MDEFESPADVLCKLSCQVCEFLFLKLSSCMKHVRKSKELELSHIIFKTHAHYIFFHEFFTSSFTTKRDFDFEVNCH